MESLISFLLQFWEQIVPWFIVKEYEEAIVLRFGKYTKKIHTPGIWFKWPFIDDPINVVTVYTTLSLAAQSLLTRDKKEIVVKSVVKYKIDNIEPFILNIYDSADAIGDVTQGVIARECLKRDWEEVASDSIDNEITKKVRVELRQFGIYVEYITLTDKTSAKAFRLFNESNLG